MSLIEVKNAIIGAGMTGLAAAYYMRGGCVVFEKEKEPGGTCRTLDAGGFKFDMAEHFIRIPNSDVKNFIKKMLGDNLFQQELSSQIYICGRYVDYPFQKNLYQLPKDVVNKCMNDFIEREKKKKGKPVRSFDDWLRASYGDFVSDLFMVPYNKKIWAVGTKEMGFSWFFNDKVVPKLSKDEFMDSCTGAKRKKEKNPRWYPKVGGVSALPQAAAKHVKDIKFGHALLSIDAAERTLEFANGAKASYRNLVSTIPLNELVARIKDCDKRILALSQKLRYNTALCINLCLNTMVDNRNHWVYFPEDKYAFSRISFPGNFAKSNCPPGKSSISAIITYTGKRVNKRWAEETTVNNLVSLGILSRRDIETIFSSEIKYGFAIPTLDRDDIVKRIQKYLISKRIHSIGRYGNWEYAGIEHSIMAGKAIAEKLR